MKKARLRICNNTDVTHLFSAHYVGGGRGFEDCPALEAYSNELAPCIKTIMGFTLIVEPITDENGQKASENVDRGGIPDEGGVWIDTYNQSYSTQAAGTIKTNINKSNLYYVTDKMANKRLEQLIQDGTVSGKHGEYIDCRSMITRDNVSGTITTTVDHNINFVAGDSDKVPSQEPQKENTKQNYVMEREVLNATADGCATTLTTAHHYSGNIIDPKRGQKEMGVLEILNPDKDGNARTIGTHYADMNAESVTRKSGDGYGYVRTAVKETISVGFRIRKLTPRTCFRLMGVDDADIDKIQAAGISKSQQYKLAGNSIVVDVLEAIFDKMFIDTENNRGQLTLF